MNSQMYGRKRRSGTGLGGGAVKTTKSPIRIAALQAEIWVQDLVNMNQEWTVQQTFITSTTRPRHYVRFTSARFLLQLMLRNSRWVQTSVGVGQSPLALTRPSASRTAAASNSATQCIFDVCSLKVKCFLQRHTHKTVCLQIKLKLQ
jgi:hypothetical protein